MEVEHNEINNMLSKYAKYKSEVNKESLKNLINRNTSFHECKEIKAVNQSLNTEITKQVYKKDDIEWVYITKDEKSGVYQMCFSYWNDEYVDFEVVSNPILICPYCGEKLI